MTEDDSGRLGRLDAAAPFLLAAAALGLRLFFLRHKHLNIDEAFELFIAGQPSLGDIVRLAREGFPQQAPLGYVLHHLLLRFTRDIGLARCLPLAWGAGSVALAYALGRLLAGRGFAWTWALLLCVSVHHVESSLTFRPYAQTLFLFLLQLYAFARMLRSGGSRWAWAAASVLLQSSYPFAFAAVAVEAAAAWRADPALRRPAALTLLAVLAIPAAWALCFSGLFLKPLFGFTAGDVFGPQVLLRVFFVFGQWDAASAVVYAALAALGAAALLRDRSTRGLALAGGAMALALLLVAQAAMWRARLFLEPRHLVALHPLYLGFVAAGLRAVLARLPAALSSGAAAPALTAAILGLSSLVPLAEYAEFTGSWQSRLSGSASFLRETIRPGDAVVTSNPNFGATFLYYYEPAALFRLEGMSLSRGLNEFVFPGALEVSNGRCANAVFTLDPEAPAGATLDRARFEELLARAAKDGSALWFLHFPMNYVYEDRPFYSLLRGLPVRLDPAAPGVYRARAI